MQTDTRMQASLRNPQERAERTSVWPITASVVGVLGRTDPQWSLFMQQNNPIRLYFSFLLFPSRTFH